MLGRNERLTRNILGTVSVRGLSLVLGLATMPAYLRFFPEREVLGLWFTLLSTFSLFVFFDFGIGNGLRSRVVKPLLEQDFATVRRLTASAYATSVGMGTAVFVGGGAIVLNVDWNSVFSTPASRISPAQFEAVMMVLLIGISLQLVFKNTIGLLYAIQRNNIVNLLSVTSSLSLLLFLLIVRSGSLSGDMLSLATANVVFTSLPALGATFWLFRSGVIGPRPGVKDFSVIATKSVLGIGSSFLAIQVALVIIASTDQILITLLFVPEYVVDYQVYLKIFGTLSMIFSLLTQPIWSAVAEAWARGDVPWVARAERLMLRSALAGAGVSLLVVGMLPGILRLWLGAGFVDVSYSTALVFALLASTDMLILASTCIANGLGELRVQLVFTSVGALVKIPLTLLLVSLFGGWQFVVLAHALVLVPLGIAQAHALRSRLGGRRARAPERRLEGVE